ncbi:hypothetical protein [Fusobacterium sp. PH5-44]|uniref:hypothetical protein n=1 Tax=unclassified Fusobacterium TaxID=2648384 RepID=UPI003D1E5BDB
MKKKMLLITSLLLFTMSLEASSKTASKNTNTTKSAKKVMKEKREDLFESLEEKVFRAPNGTKAKIQATDSAFDVGKKRMYYLQREEDNIRALESELGMEETEHNFLTEKYDAVMEEFKTTKNEIEALELENKKLKEYLKRLNAMEARAKFGKK